MSPDKIFAFYCRIWRTYRFQFPKDHRISFDNLLTEIVEDSALDDVSSRLEMVLVCHSIGKKLRREVNEYFTAAEIGSLRTRTAEIITIIAGIFGIIGVIIAILHFLGFGR